MRIDLTAGDMLECVQLASARGTSKLLPDGGRVFNRAVDHRSHFELDLIGIMAEWATARALGVEPDRSTSLAGDAGIDLWFRGRSVQVKASTSQEGVHLFFNRLADFKADCAVFAFVAGPASVRLLGWIDRAEFVRRAHPLVFHGRPRIGLQASSMHPLATLLADTTAPAS